MPCFSSRTPRLYVDAALEEGAGVALLPAQAHYLGNVLRLKTGDGVLVFNGRDGEWRGVLAATRTRRLALKSPNAPVRRNSSAICTTCSRRSNTRASTTWRRRRSRWAPLGCSRCSPATPKWHA